MRDLSIPCFPAGRRWPAAHGLQQQLPAKVQRAHLLPAKPSKCPQLPKAIQLATRAWGRELLPPGSASQTVSAYRSQPAACGMDSSCHWGCSARQCRFSQPKAVQVAPQSSPHFHKCELGCYGDICAVRPAMQVLGSAQSGCSSCGQAQRYLRPGPAVAPLSWCPAQSW